MTKYCKDICSDNLSVFYDRARLLIVFKNNSWFICRQNCQSDFGLCFQCIHLTTVLFVHSICREPEEARYKSIMVVHGDRGSGKSTLISNWIQKFKVENPDVKVLCQYVGCSGRSSDISVFLRQCIKELRENYLSKYIFP